MRPHALLASAVAVTLACGGAKTAPPADQASPIDDFEPVVFDAGPSMPSAAGSKPPPKYSDAGVYATPSTPMEVFCGPMTCGAGTQQCCIQPGVGPSCAARCDSELTFACDGPEDCTGGGRCCITVVSNRVTLSCSPDCDHAATTACHSRNDCPSERPMCCRNEAPIGRCLPPGGAEPGDVCDL